MIYFSVPVEGCFSVLKASIKRQLSARNPRNDVAEAGDLLLVNYRANLLREALDRSLPDLTRVKIRNFIVK